MEVLQNASEFSDFICSLAASAKEKSDLTYRLQVYKEEYSVTALPAGTTTPFDDFTGPLEGVTLVVSKYEPTLSHDSELGLSTLESSLTSVENELVEKTERSFESLQGKKDDKFPCLFYQTVNVGQPLSQKRQFLTQSTSLHSGYTEHNVVSDCTLAYDTGLVPLSLNKARYVASLFALSSRKATHKLPNVWAICKDERRPIVAIGCSHDIVNGKGSIQCYTVTAESLLQKSQVSGPEKLKGKTWNTSETSAFSEYEIASYSVTSEAGRGKDKLGDLTVQFAWNGPEAVLSSPPECADAVIKISATPGYLFSPGISSYNELNTVLHLCKIAAGEATWPYQLSDSIDEEDPTTQPAKEVLSEKIGTFLADVSSPLSTFKEMSVMSPTSENKLFEQRKDLDFVERLWLFAKDATSLEDLQKIFAEVFKAVLLGKVQPFVHRSSTSVLSTLLRKVLLSSGMEEKQDLAPKFQNLLTESKICACLVQVGIEKMTRDYRAFFIGAEIATGDQLDQFISPCQGSQLDQCHALCKLHCILELMSSILLLQLPPPTLSALFKTAAEVYRERRFEGLTTTPVFCLPLPAYSIGQKTLASFCATLMPKKWSLSQLASKSGDSGANKSKITVYASRPLFDNIRHKEEDKDTYHVYKAQCECI